MGNEASRPSMEGSPRAAGGPAPPTPTPTPSSYAAQRRTQSFPARAPSPSPSKSPSPLPSTPRAPPRVDKTIQRMDKAIRKRVRGGITYNMKLLIRGDRGTGKTSLFHRLQGLPIPSAHSPTPQLQTATINWNLRVGTEESVKCEVWDVVDRGFVPSADGDDEADAAPGSGPVDDDEALKAAAAAAAAAAMGGYTYAGASGMHVVAAVDASTVDVYHEAHGVIFLLDVTKWESLEYVRQQLESVPPHIPTLVLGNFRDCAAHQRKVFKEDIQALLYGSSDQSLKQQQALRRPQELLYFECSLLNCYGLKALHQYFGIPFLQLKLATIRQQLRIVEGEFSHLKNDLQATIREQRYVDYLEHIKSTGSDIRTGRRASNGQLEGPGVASPSPTNESNGRPPRPDAGSEAAKTPQRTSSIVSDTSDVVVSSFANGNESDRSTPVAPASASTYATDSVVIEQDLGDLPERDDSTLSQVMPPLKIQHIEPAPAASTTTSEDASKRANNGVEDVNVAASSDLSNTAMATADAQPNGKEKNSKTSKAKKTTTKKSEEGKSQSTRARKPSMDEPMGLEDFQVPGQRNSDLDHFYSDDESAEEEEEDEDVVVTVADTGLTKISSGRSHKQIFIDSDSSDSEKEERKSTRATAPSKSKRRSPSSPRKRSPAGKSRHDESSRAHDRVVENKQAPVTSPPPPVASPPRPPSPAKSPRASPRVRSRGSSPSRSSPVHASHPDVSTQSVKREPANDAEMVPPPSAEEPIEVSKAAEDIATSVGNADPSQLTTEDEASGSPRAPSAPPSPHVPAAPRREDRYTSPNSSRRNSAVSVTSADAVDGFDSEAVAVGRHLEVEAEQSPQSIVADHELDGSTQHSEANKAEQEKAVDESAPETSSVAAVSQVDVDAADPVVVVDSAVVEPERTGLEVETTKADAGATNAAKSPAADSEDDDFGVDVVSSAADMDAFLMDGDGSSDEDVEKKVLSPSGSSHSGEQKPSAGLDKKSVGRAWEVAQEDKLPTGSTTARSRPLVEESDDDDNDDDDDDDDADEREEPMETPLQRLGVMRASRAVASSTTASTAVHNALPPSVTPKNDLEAFLNESDSDSDGGAGPRWSSVSQAQPGRRASSGEDDDDDDESVRERLSSYNVSRKSRAQRRQEREELRQFSVALDASKRDLDSPVASTASAGGAEGSADTKSIENSDVLAAIRRAQEEAMRMLSSVAGEEVAPSEAQPAEKKRRDKKKDAPRKKSSRHAGDAEEDGRDRSSKHRSSRRTSKKSSSSSSSRSRRQLVANSDSD